VNYFIHVANLVYLGSYWCKDVRKLRWLTILGIVLLIPYYLVQVEPLYAAALWNVFFLGVNMFRLFKSEKDPVTVANAGQQCKSSNAYA
jgi:hypothetical protein